MDEKGFFEGAKERWVAAGYPNYPPWVPLVFHSFTVVALFAAILQRIPAGDALPAAGLAGLSIAAYTVGELLGPRLSWAVLAIVTLLPVGILRWKYPVDLDFVLLAVALLVGRWGALESMRRSATVFAVTIAGVIGIGLTDDFNGTAFVVAVILAGWELGSMLQSMQRRFDQAELEQEARSAKAALEERQRIAREVHDVVAHSLSVTLLHLTAARRDLEDGGDVDEVVDALRDAEIVGRQAMQDIRQTVGLLGDTTGRTTSAPDLADVPALVQQFRAAGLDVAYDTAGDAAALPAAARTGLYRIVQESLANIAKHEPRARATVELDLSTDPARLAVRNTLTRQAPVNTDGRGLHGMSERASSLGGTLTAGPDGKDWQVLLELPNPHAHSCALPKLRDMVRPAPETA